MRAALVLFVFCVLTLVAARHHGKPQSQAKISLFPALDVVDSRMRALTINSLASAVALETVVVPGGDVPFYTDDIPASEVKALMNAYLAVDFEANATDFYLLFDETRSVYVPNAAPFLHESAFPVSVGRAAIIRDLTAAVEYANALAGGFLFSVPQVHYSIRGNMVFVAVNNVYRMPNGEDYDFYNAGFLIFQRNPVDHKLYITMEFDFFDETSAVVLATAFFTDKFSMENPEYGIPLSGLGRPAGLIPSIPTLNPNKAYPYLDQVDRFEALLSISNVAYWRAKSQLNVPGGNDKLRVTTYSQLEVKAALNVFLALGPLAPGLLDLHWQAYFYLYTNNANYVPQDLQLQVGRAQIKAEQLGNFTEIRDLKINVVTYVIKDNLVDLFAFWEYRRVIDGVLTTLSYPVQTMLRYGGNGRFDFGMDYVDEQAVDYIKALAA